MTMFDEETFKEAVSALVKINQKRKEWSLNIPAPWPPKKYTVWEGEYCGFRCAVCSGIALCGYVRVPEGHPAYRRHYDDIPVDIHGGLTFNKLSPEGFWVGFDCGHYGDEMMSWNVETVKEETRRLAEQLAAMTTEAAR